MAGAKTDILARFELKETGEGIPAECPLLISPSDSLAMKRMSDPAYGGPFTPGSFCLVDSFSFDVQLLDKESAEHKMRVQKSIAEDVVGEGDVEESKLDKSVSKGFNPASQEFALWRMPPDDDRSNGRNALQNFSAKAGDFSLKRRVDSASPKLFEMCCGQLPLAYVSIIKRTMAPARGGGGSGTGAMEAISFLRLDFSDVMVIGVDWSDGDILEETCKLQARSLALRYMAQDANGKLSAVEGYIWQPAVAGKAIAKPKN
jgi:type VI protein secretion system component Hcp